MAFSPGYKAWVMLDGANGAGTNISAYVDNFGLPYSTEMLDVSVFGSATKRYIPGLAGGDTFSMSGPLETGFATIVHGILAAQAAGTASFTAIYAPAGSASGLPRATAEVLVASYEVSTGVGGRAEYSASLQLDGAVTFATW